jgi:signal transduction histidine kinase
MVSILFYFLYQERIKQVLKVEKLRSRISSDLHDDIGSTLSSISILSDIAIQERNRRESKQMVKEIKDNSVMLMEKMDDIVWSINPKNDSLENLMLRIKRFASRLFEAKEIDYKIIIDENVKHARLSMEHRQHIYMILKEGVNNIIKYSSATEASIIVKFEKDLLNITISDNGIGFEREKILYGNGLLNMEERASIMKADLSILSTAGKGTTIILNTKIK